jgi:hypothetical protein
MAKIQSNNVDKRHRVQLNFSDAGFAELIQLKEKMGVSQQELFKAALRWLQWTYEEVLAGNKIQIKEPDGNVKEVVATFLIPSSRNHDRLSNHG